MTERMPQVSDPVVYVDPVAVQHAALITAVWGKTCVNVVVVSRDTNRRDSYGQQIERVTSCVHKTMNEAHGNYWRFPDEEPKATEIEYGYQYSVVADSATH